MTYSPKVLAIVGFGFIVTAPHVAFAGIEETLVPEPTALLVWAGLAGIGGLFFWRRQRDAD
jgi:MYXO-CTERM domain-containing protein